MHVYPVGLVNPLSTFLVKSALCNFSDYNPNDFTHTTVPTFSIAVNNVIIAPLAGF